jgi:nitrite reductase/ring-hydroxylating ferredoxin subunit
MPELVEVGKVDELPVGETVTIDVGGRELVLIRWRGEVYALRNICPHMSTSFSKGSMIAGHRAGTVGEVTVDHDDPVIACPWHKYEFRLKDGRCLSDASLRVRSYPVVIADGRILVDLKGYRRDKRAATARKQQRRTRSHRVEREPEPRAAAESARESQG